MDDFDCKFCQVGTRPRWAKSKPQTFLHIFAIYWLIFNFFFTGTFCGKFVINWLLNKPPHLNCAATLPCEVKFSKTGRYGRYVGYKNLRLTFLAQPVFFANSSVVMGWEHYYLDNPVHVFQRDHVTICTVDAVWWVPTTDHFDSLLLQSSTFQHLPQYACFSTLTLKYFR